MIAPRTSCAFTRSLAAAGTSIPAAGIAEALVTRVGPKYVMASGLALLGGGLLFFTQISVNGHHPSDLLAGLVMSERASGSRSSRSRSSG